MEMKKVVNLAKQTLRIIFVIATNLYCIPTYLMWTWVIFLPLRLLNHPFYWYMEGLMYKWLLAMVASWSWEAQYYIVEIGDDISAYLGQRCLLVVNHQSTADVPFLMAAFQEKGNLLESVMWIMDRMFRYTNFGIVSMTHGDYFITQGKNAREHQMKKLTDHLLNAYLVRKRGWIVLFPEGGFLSKRRETSIKYAKENNFPVLERVTLPRVGAMHVILNTLHPKALDSYLAGKCNPLLKGSKGHIEPLKWVIDVTIGYPDGDNPLDLLAICSASRPSCTTYIHYRCYPVEDVPSEDMDSLRDWVYDRWCEKEELLNGYYSSGTFPVTPSSNSTDNSHSSVRRTHQVTVNNLWLGFLHIFFLTSSYFHYCLLRGLWSYTF